MTIENYLDKYMKSSRSSSGIEHQQSLKSASSTSTQMARSTMIDEDQLVKTFQEIVNCINLDDDEEEVNSINSGFNSGKLKNNNTNFHEDSHYRTVQVHQSSHLHQQHSQAQAQAQAKAPTSQQQSATVSSPSIPEFNSIFGSFNMAVGSEKPAQNPQKSTSSSSNTATTGTTANTTTHAMFGGFEGALGKSFLDDDWSSISKSIRDQNEDNDYCGISRSMTPVTIKSTNISNVNSMITPPRGPSMNNMNNMMNMNNNTSGGNNTNTMPLPSDYVCKLCNNSGHWMKDCKLYEPRTINYGKNNFTFNNANANVSSNINCNSNNVNGGNNFDSRTLLPPGNYVCRLCNVAGHWIDECSKFQPKLMNSSDITAAGTMSGNHSNNSNASNNNTCSSTVMLPPMLGPGPTANYRPPAYLSKPVPSNYLCNLCNRPGHWIQQCTEFTPIINHKPRLNEKYI